MKCKFTDFILLTLAVLYVLCAIISFGHSAQNTVKPSGSLDMIAFTNTMTGGVFWPYYAAYVFFEEGGR